MSLEFTANVCIYTDFQYYHGIFKSLTTKKGRNWNEQTSKAEKEQSTLSLHLFISKTCFNY